MSKPFVVAEKTLAKHKKEFRLEADPESGDGFFIDSKYKQKANRVEFRKKFLLLFVAIFVITAILASRVFYLQIVKGETYHSLAEGNRIWREVLPAVRGVFYDRDGEQLAFNLPEFKLVVAIDRFENLEEKKQKALVKKIDSLTLVDKGEIEKELQKQMQKEKVESVIRRTAEFEMEYETALNFKSSLNKPEGLSVVLDSQRKYRQTENLGHVLGYLGKITTDEWKKINKDEYQLSDKIGKSGLELFYEKELKGKPGYLDVEVNATGEVLNYLNKTKPLPGNDLFLTIDYSLTEKVAQVLSDHLKNINKNKATVVITQPQTGEILSLVSWPGFDNNVFVEADKNQEKIESYLADENLPLFNRAVAGEYPSGSTIKPAIALAGLEDGVVGRWTTVLSTGGIKINEWFYPDWLAGGHGQTEVTKALAQSVNTYFYYVGGGYKDFRGLGLEKINEYLKMFGFGSQLGIDLPNEASGFLPTREWKKATKGEDWYIGDTYHLSIGQGDFLATPLQINSLTTMVANGGKLFKPFLVKEIKNSRGELKEKKESKIIDKNFINEENIKIVQQGLRRAVLSGSAIGLSLLEVESAGKTGTAQVGGDKKPHAWFSGYAPYENPELAITVLVENGGEGSEVCVPIARDILAWYFDKQENKEN